MCFKRKKVQNTNCSHVTSTFRDDTNRTPRKVLLPITGKSKYLISLSWHWFSVQWYQDALSEATCTQIFHFTTTAYYYKVYAIGCNQASDLSQHHWHLDFSPNIETVTHFMLPSAYISEWKKMTWSSALNNYDAEMFCRSDQAVTCSTEQWRYLASLHLKSCTQQFLSVWLRINTQVFWLHGKKIFRLIQQH